MNNVVKGNYQPYTNERLFKRREQALLAHIRTPTVPKLNSNRNCLLQHKRSYRQVYLTEAEEKLSKSCCKHIRVLPGCKSEHDLLRRKLLHHEREPSRDCINRLRELMLMRSSTDAKKERVLRLKQTYDNELSGLTGMMSSLNESKVLFTETFAVKFDEHVKQLQHQAESEKRKLSSIVQAVIKYKHDIKHIQTQIKKIELDKANVLKWLYFQIKVRERKLTLPTHYTTILERKGISYAYSSDGRSMRKNTRKLNTLQQLIPLGEIERICKYKHHLIYNTADAFVNQLHQIEQDNIARLGVYGAVLNKLQLLRQEREALCLQTQLHRTHKQHEIDVKTKELSKLKRKHAKLLKSIADLTLASGNNCASARCPLVLGQKNTKVDTPCASKECKLFNKVVDLYNTTLDITCSSVHCGVARGNEVLMMLKYIEIAVDGLFSMFNYYNNNKQLYYDKLRQIQTQIETAHKLEHAQHQVELGKLKAQRLHKQIQQRNNKVLYKQHRKVNAYYKCLMKSNSPQTPRAVPTPQPTFHEFMHDVIDDDNNY